MPKTVLYFVIGSRSELTERSRSLPFASLEAAWKAAWKNKQTYTGVSYCVEEVTTDGTRVDVITYTRKGLA